MKYNYLATITVLTLKSINLFYASQGFFVPTQILFCAFCAQESLMQKRPSKSMLIIIILCTGITKISMLDITSTIQRQVRNSYYFLQNNIIKDKVILLLIRTLRKFQLVAYSSLQYLVFKSSFPIIFSVKSNFFFN